MKGTIYHSMSISGAHTSLIAFGTQHSQDHHHRTHEAITHDDDIQRFGTASLTPQGEWVWNNN